MRPRRLPSRRRLQERPAPVERIGDDLQSREAAHRRKIALEAIRCYRQMQKMQPEGFTGFLQAIEEERDERGKRFPHPGPSREAMLAELDREEWRLSFWLDYCAGRSDCLSCLSKLLEEHRLEELKTAIQEHFRSEAAAMTENQKP